MRDYTCPLRGSVTCMEGVGSLRGSGSSRMDWPASSLGLSGHRREHPGALPGSFVQSPHQLARSADELILSRRENCLSAGFLRWMMPHMPRFPVRIVCHAILRIDLVPAHVRELESTIRQRCQDSDAQLVDFCVDLGTPKRRPEDYPALSYFRAGKADALLIVCVPSDEPLPRGDL